MVTLYIDIDLKEESAMSDKEEEKP